MIRVLNQVVQLKEKECENLPNKLNLTTKETLLTSSHISMVDPLYSDFPMEMDLLGEEDKEVANKEKMVLEGSKAIDIVIKMKNDGRWPILGKRGRVLGLNSSKKKIWNEQNN